MTTVTISTRFGTSCRIGIENRIAKNGDILFRMLASARPMWSIAQKLQTRPREPKRARQNSDGRDPFRIWNFSFERSSVITATMLAMKFRKKAFSMVGRSPESRTMAVIREKKKESAMTSRIPISSGLRSFFTEIPPEYTSDLTAGQGGLQEKRSIPCVSSFAADDRLAGIVRAYICIALIAVSPCPGRGPDSAFPPQCPSLPGF